MGSVEQTGAVPSRLSLSRVGASLQRLSDGVDQAIVLCFRWWSAIVSSRPYTTIVVATVFGLLWGFAFFALFEQELDTDDLFTPNNAQSFDDRRYIESVFDSGSDQAALVCIRHQTLRDDSCASRLLLKDVETARESVQELFAQYKELRDFAVYYEGEAFRLEDICFRPATNAPCLVTSILDLWDYNETIIESPDFNPLDQINSDEELLDRFGIPLNFDLHLGKAENANCEVPLERSSNIEALRMKIVYQEDNEEIDGAEYDPESTEWLEGIADYAREISKESTLDCYMADGVIVALDAEEQLQEDIQLLTIGYALLLIYTNVVLHRNSCHSCKMHLSVASVLGIGLAVLSSFGICQTIGLKFNSIIQLLPFLILGLGIDDTFVIIGAYQKLPFDLSVPEKISQTLERAGTSIFVTSATDCCAFAMGMYTQLRAMRAFSAYATLAILFDFLYQVTFFVAFLVLEARREARYRNGGTPCGMKLSCVSSPYDETEVLDQPPEGQEMKDVAANDAEAASPARESTETVSHVKNPAVWNKMCGSGQYDPAKPSFSTKLVGTYLPAITLHPIGRIAVLVAECGLIAFAIYGCTRVKTEFKFIDWFAVDGSAVQTAFNIERDFFFFDQQFFGVYTKEAEAGDYFYHQDELEALKTALDTDPYVVPPVHTWYEGYSSWLLEESNYTDLLVSGRAPNATAFNSWLKEYLAGPGLVYNASVVFSDDTPSRIVSTKTDAATVSVEDGQFAMDMLDSIRESIESAAPSFDPVAYTHFFLFVDGYRVIAWETIRNVLLAALGVFIMNVVVLANLATACIVVSMVGLTDLFVIGYMWYVDQYFNPVSAVLLVLVVGIAVDYSAHIAHSFMVLPGDRGTRAKAALEHIGGEVLSGAFTTWLGIVVMGFAEHYFFQSFFKMFFAIITAGAWHGLVLLPVILSFIGSQPYTSRIQY